MALHAIERQSGLRVVWCSPREAVVWKPPGMASELSDDAKGVSALERVRRAGFARARLPHRLDRVACGLLLIALDDGSVAHHGAQIQSGAWEKWYLARLAVRAGATPTSLVGEHRAYVRRRGARAELVRAGGQPSRLGVLAAEAVVAATASGERREVRIGGATVADALIRLHTGRYHQIRAMMAGLGAPLVGDALYGGPGEGVYLEHFALRFVPCDAAGDGTDRPVLVCGRGFGRRPGIAPDVWEAAEAIDRGDG